MGLTYGCSFLLLSVEFGADVFLIASHPAMRVRVQDTPFDNMVHLIVAFVQLGEQNGH